MKNSIFPRLAADTIRKNGKLYIPYIISCVGMVMMYFIIHSLSCSPLIVGMPHGSNITMALSLGKFVILVFSAIFLLYTNSFLIRRRDKEFGLYNVLGMNKRDIAKVLFYESFYISLISLVLGIGLGALFTKVFELILLNFTRSEVSFNFTFSTQALIFTVGFYILVFFILFVKSLFKISISNPLDMLKSETAGEKPPKANWAFALVGFILLAVAYYLAVSITNPIDALIWFFVAVILVIIATYILFMAGSVAICKLLQKNEKYYYKKNHFISVSSMAYRMKRNGAGLASICVLCTMVLVMLSSTVSLYAGSEDILADRYPRDNMVEILFTDKADLADEKLDAVRKSYKVEADKANVTMENVMDYRYAFITGLVSDGKTDVDVDSKMGAINGYKNLRALMFMTVDDYNKAMGTNIKLNDGEAMTYTIRCKYNDETFQMDDTALKIVGELDEYPAIPDASVNVVASICFVINDLDELKSLDEKYDYTGSKSLLYKWMYAYDVDLEPDAAYEMVLEQTRHIDLESGSMSCSSKGVERTDYYTTFGGFLFLGGLLSIIFIAAAALIIYYKQISEGYEDQKRFEIMQNVGMTKGEIKKSINSQVLTVFFLPILFAGVHLCFSFPFLWKILILFGFSNKIFLILVTFGVFVVFSLIYAAIYKITARIYYNIVSTRSADA